MKIFSKIKFVALLLIILVQFVFVPPQRAYAAQSTVSLGTAAPFAILAGTPVITDSPTSSITGNVGLYPAAGSGITGLICTQVTGTIYARTGGNVCFTVDDALLLAAKNDLTAAYTDAAGRTPVTTINTELGGHTLVPGVYASGATTFGITAGAGPLVLDAQGDPNAVFIFEVAAAATGLTVGPGSVVSLANGACASNIFWRVDSAAIDTTAVFKGNILALNSISVANGANIEGRLLARNGQVTLINDTIKLPTTCATVTATSSLSSAGAPSSAYCQDISEQVVPPSIIESKRVSPTSISLSWGPYSGINVFNVEYGLTNGSWLYNTNVTGFSTTINSLPANQPIWVRIAASNYCTIGDYGQSKLVGGPGLPNTGFAPRENNMWYIPMAIIFVGVFVLRLSPRH